MLKLKNLITRQTTQKQVAEDLKMTPQTLSNYINGKTQPDCETLIKFADYFKVTVDTLLGHEVPYLLDKSTLTEKQKDIASLLPLMSDRVCEKAEAYISGLLEGEQDKQATIQRFKN